jgi:hypothetical protein
MAILAMGGGSDLAAEHLGHELDAVADAKHGNAEVEQGGVRTGRALSADAGWSTGEDYPTDTVGPEGGGVDAEGIDAGVDPAFTDAPSDDLGILGPEVEDSDGLVGHGREDVEGVRT